MDDKDEIVRLYDYEYIVRHDGQRKSARWVTKKHMRGFLVDGEIYPWEEIDIEEVWEAGNLIFSKKEWAKELIKAINDNPYLMLCLMLKKQEDMLQDYSDTLFSKFAGLPFYLYQSLNVIEKKPCRMGFDQVSVIMVFDKNLYEKIKIAIPTGMIRKWIHKVCECVYITLRPGEVIVDGLENPVK